MALPSSAVSFLFPVLWNCAHRHTQRCVFYVVAGLLKLVLMKIDHHTRSHHTVQMASNSRSFCLNFPNARVMGICYRTFRASSTSHSPCILGIPLLLSLYMVAQLPRLISFVSIHCAQVVSRGEKGHEQSSVLRLESGAQNAFYHWVGQSPFIRLGLTCKGCREM